MDGFLRELVYAVLATAVPLVAGFAVRALHGLAGKIRSDTMREAAQIAELSEHVDAIESRLEEHEARLDERASRTR